jgi:alpha-glucosidase
MHDPALRDNPPAPRDGRKISRPFDYQSHTYNMSHPAIVTFLERLRSVVDEYESVFTVAEVGGPNPLAEMKAFTANDKRLNSAYSFDFLYAEKLSAAHTEKSVMAWTGAPGEGWPSWAFSNHDAPRAVSRWAREKDLGRAARLYAMLLISLRGNVFLYQGEELGLPQAYVPYEALQDPEAIANWPLTLGRDGARTPMPWRRGGANSGFSVAKPWLPVDPRHDALSIDLQEADPRSTLNFVKRLIRIRRESETLRLGSVIFYDAPDGVIAFSRFYEGDRINCVFNIGDQVATWKVDDVGTELIIATGVDRASTAPPEKLPELSGYLERVLR